MRKSQRQAPRYPVEARVDYRQSYPEHAFSSSLFDTAPLLHVLLQTAFKGKVYMTHATKAIYKLLLLDFVRVSKVAVEDMLYDEHDLERSMAKIEVGLLTPILPFV